MKKRMIALLLAACLGAMLALPACAEEFSDVPEDAWYYQAVGRVTRDGWMTGSGGDAFSPDSAAARWTVVYALWNLRGRPAAVAARAFSDIPENAEYAQAAVWACENYVAFGFDDGTFRPEAPVTRIQFALFLYRYDKWFGGRGLGGVWSGPLPFTDGAAITGDMTDAAAWTNLHGIMTGYSDGSFRPGRSVSRAEAAVALVRYWTDLQPADGVTV